MPLLPLRSAASTQPPETEPRKLPSPSITRFEPTGRGAEPQVSTTVASATSLPALRQSSAALRMSSSRASMIRLLPSVRHCERSEAISVNGRDCFVALRAPRNDGSYILRHFPQPSLRIARPCVRGERPAQLGHGFEIVDRAELIDRRQHGADALGLGLEPFEAQQRIEP